MNITGDSMYLLTKENTQEVAGGCTVSVGNYHFDATGVDCAYALTLANMANYDLSTSGLIGYQPNGYSVNPYSTQAVMYGVDHNCFEPQYYLFFKALRQAVPAYLMA